MRSYETLPEGYRQIASIDLQKDKKLLWVVNIGATLIAVLMMLIAMWFVPLRSLSEDDGLAVRMLWILGLTLAYLVLHEAVHGIFMRRYSNAKVRFGVTGPYAYAASDGYFCRKHYCIIGLSPIVIWGVVLLIANFLVDESWFYVVYLVQMMNISGAAGDLYVSGWLAGLPEDVLIRDTGVAMTAYSACNE